MTFVPGSLLIYSSPAVVDHAGPVGESSQPLASVTEMKALRTGIDQRLREYLAAQRVEYAKYSIFSTLYDDMAEFACRPGKRLRPLLFLLAYRIFKNGGAAIAMRDLLSVGVSLELLHAFILVHDDIIDRAETRRGLPTLHRVAESRLSSFTDRRRAGRNLSLVMGDILFALAQRCLLQTPLPANAVAQLGTMLLGCMVETGIGEVADIVHSTRDVAKVSQAEIEQMYCLKTTCYTIECPVAMAAVLCGVDDDGIESLGRIARPAGLAFQIQNDLQEFARFEVSDSEIPADILEGKKTLLMRTAFDLLNETDQALLQLCFSTSTPTEGTLSKARELISKSGAVTKLSERMHELFDAAETEIGRSAFAPCVQHGLSSLIQLVGRPRDLYSC